MKKKKKLSKAERLEIAILLGKNYSRREIAKVMERSPNTISYEINKNSTNGVYDPNQAQVKARRNLKNRRFQWRKINHNGKLRQYIIVGLKKDWNPDEVSGRMKLENKSFQVSKTTIYEWLYSNRGQRYCKYLYSKRHQPKKRMITKEKRVLIPNRVSIDQRSVGANNRTRYGHWESDAIVSGKRGFGSLAVSVERKSRLGRINQCASMSPREHGGAHYKVAVEHKTLSMTYDNGLENRDHIKLNNQGIPTYFCTPYSSWEKGGVENFNKMIRRRIPKGSDISKFSVEYIQRVEDLINDKPRKILGYKTSREVAETAKIIRSYT